MSKHRTQKTRRQLRVQRLVRPIGIIKPIGPSSTDFEAWLATRPDIAARFQDSKPYASQHTAYEVWRSAWLACEREHGIRPNDLRERPATPDSRQPKTL